MGVSDEFQDLIHRVRNGDEDATTALSEQYGPFILRFVRFRIRARENRERLRRFIDSGDVCQSVLISLCSGLRKGRFVLNGPEQLEKLVCTLVKLKIATQARKPAVLRRDLSAIPQDDSRGAIIDEAPGPVQEVAGRDLLEAVLRQFSETELELLVRWDGGQSWAEIAAELGSTAEAHRKRLERAMKRVRDQFDLENLFEI